MGWLETLVLAVVQGLTEFLPVSSDGHLVLGGALFGGLPEGFLRFELLLHLGTVLAAVLFYRREVATIILSLLPGAAPERAAARRTALLVLAALVPTAIVVTALEPFFASLHASPWAAVAGLGANGSMLLAAGLLLPARTGSLERMPWWVAGLIGLAQCAAPAPGISRSGTTIVAGLALGLAREDAVRFSFLLSIPTVAGAVLLDLAGGAPEILAPGLALAGVATAAATGYAAILLVLRWTRAGRLWAFGAYCLAAAAGGAALLAAR